MRDGDFCSRCRASDTLLFAILLSLTFIEEGPLDSLAVCTRCICHSAAAHTSRRCHLLLLSEALCTYGSDVLAALQCITAFHLLLYIVCLGHTSWLPKGVAPVVQYRIKHSSPTKVLSLMGDRNIPIGLGILDAGLRTLSTGVRHAHSHSSIHTRYAFSCLLLR
jgi:hypothetical protein